jgi:hypothetical protein
MSHSTSKDLYHQHCKTLKKEIEEALENGKTFLVHVSVESIL